MTNKILLKGFEEEIFTGTFLGEHVGVAADVTQELPDFVKEPDHRNLEYITEPIFNYGCLREALLEPRKRLRNWLALRNLTLIPGSTLSLGDSKKFERSDPSNPYHDLIEESYGTRVVTTSVHINLGIEDLDLLFSANRLVRCEAALFLALSASSPFLDGHPTGVHSQRWMQFPLTPEKVPLFESHSQYVGWVENQLASGAMRNERHLWTSVRPNGSNRPYELNRLELRICDLITDFDLLLAITALLELRVLSLFQDLKKLDPIEASSLNSEQLANLSDMNDHLAAKSSLDAKLHHWRDGKPIICRNWIRDLLNHVKPLAMDMDMLHLLSPLENVLSEGNQAMKWLQSYSVGKSVGFILQESILEMARQEDSQKEYSVKP